MSEDSFWAANNYLSGSELMESGDSFNSFPSEGIMESILDRPKMILTPRLVPDLYRKRASGVQCFEEDARSSWSVDSCRNTSGNLKEVVLDEDSQNSFSSHRSYRSSFKRRYFDDEVANTTRHFNINDLFEYQWPVGKGDYYILQEQISDFLCIKSFRRRYPDLTRRVVEPEERRYLKEKGVVSEMQCELGLTAIKADDILELISKDFPDKFHEYLQMLQEKERQSVSEKFKEYAPPNVDKNKMSEFVKKAVHSAAEYNTHLNHERKEERKASFDLQTYTIHYPNNRITKLNKDGPTMGLYPVALLPGQYQDYYRKYSSQELKYLPVNTVLYGPPQELGTVYVQPSSDGSQSDSEESSASEISCSSSQCTHGSGESSSGSEMTKSKSSTYSVSQKNILIPPTTYRQKHKPNAICKVCQGNSEVNKEGKSEELIHCSECNNSNHPSCLDLSSSMVEAIKTYPWQCMDCKTCMLCMDPYDEDKMMFCDNCDRGYHTFCVGLKSIPSGRWVCRLCSQCTASGVRGHASENSRNSVNK
ncbi:PHD finger protein 10-like [Centruroides sculpturatus]|uniref:PHD finger protein 10-like n=1 Tax=Centruroides sculpturatus TaxID=218467 RepID=UPI000C6D4EDB|nr:PHD finger protein 10-like [Centruroides sculpturatus]XP_023211121.1 PHD finger protein 10-like [Centruroides sculpturatus]